jgi:hypothetical protein
MYITRKIELIYTINTINTKYSVREWAMGSAQGGKALISCLLIYPMAAHRPFGCACATKNESGTTFQTTPTTTNDPHHRFHSTTTHDACLKNVGPQLNECKAGPNDVVWAPGMFFIVDFFFLLNTLSF